MGVRPRRGRPSLALVLALALAAIATTGCGAATAPPPELGDVPTSPGDPTILRHPAGVLIDVPDGWRSEEDGDTLTLLSSEDSIITIFVVVDAEDVELALQALDEIIRPIVPDSEMIRVGKTELGGMRAVVAEGRGSIEGSPVDLGIALIETPKKRVMIMLGVVSEDATDATQRQLDGMLSSIRPDPRP